MTVTVKIRKSSHNQETYRWTRDNGADQVIPAAERPKNQLLLVSRH